MKCDLWSRFSLAQKNDCETPMQNALEVMLEASLKSAIFIFTGRSGGGRSRTHFVSPSAYAKWAI